MKKLHKLGIIVGIVLLISIMGVFLIQRNFTITCEEANGECVTEEECPINQIKPTFTHNPLCSEGKVCCYKINQ